MAQITTDQTAPFIQRLGRLRFEARRTIALRSLGILTVTLLSLTAFTFLFDWLFRFDPVQRRILAVLCWGGVLYLLYRYAFRPLSAELPDERLALLVERQHPAIGDRLISALQFERLSRSGQLQGSAVFVEVVLREAGEALRGVDFDRCIDPEPRKQGMKRIGIIALLCAYLAAGTLSVGWGGWGIDTPEIGRLTASRITAPWIPAWAWGTWFDRMVALGDAEWPKRSGIEVVGHRDYMARGESYSLEVEADLERPQTPDYVVVHYRFEGWKDWSKLEVPARVEKDEATGEVVRVTYRTDEPFKRLMQPVEYWVEGGDDESEVLSIGLTDRPAIAHLVFIADYPEYSKGGNDRFTIDEEELVLVHGTRLTIEMRTNKKLEWAHLVINREDGAETRKFTAVDGTVNGYRFQTTIDDSWPDRSECEIQLLGFEGLRQPEPKKFTIFAHPDQAPEAELQIKWLKRRRVTWNADLPLWLEVEDDFAIKNIEIKYQVTFENGQKSDIGRRVFPRGQFTYGARKIGPVTLADGAGFPLEAVGLRTGDRLTFHLEAEDFFERPDGSPQVGSSREIELRIVDASDLIKEINVRQSAQSQELEKILDKERETKYATLNLLTAFERQGQVLEEGDLSQLASLERRQRSFIAKLQMIVEEFSSMRLEMKYNRLYEEDIYDGLIRDQVIQPLEGLHSKPLLETAHRYADIANDPQPGRVEAELRQVVTQIDQIVSVLADVLSKIERLEKFGEIIVKVKQVYEAQRKLLDDTKAEHVRKIETMIGDEFDDMFDDDE